MPYRSRDHTRYRKQARTVPGATRYGARPAPLPWGRWLAILLGAALLVVLPVVLWRHLGPLIFHRFSGTTAGQPLITDPNAYVAIDSLALAVQPKAGETVETFARRLVKPARNELEKARAIFRWIAANVEYDEALDIGQFSEAETPANVLAKRRTICTGYSRLYEAMAVAAGLECEVISGWSKDPIKITGGAPNHAWNAVKVDHQWRLLDVTWAAGGHERDPQGRREFVGWYFSPDPQFFIQSHLPSHPVWQLVDPPMTKEHFDAMPHTWGYFYECGLALSDHFDKTILAQNGQVRLRVQAPPDVYMNAELYRGGAKLPLSASAAGRLPGTSLYEWVFDTQAQNPDQLIVFACKSLNGTYRSVLEYSVKENSP